MKRNHYQTAGRRALAAFLQEHPDCHFTAEELYAAVSGTTSVGKSSIYRQLSELITDGVVRKNRQDARGAFVYQYIGDRCDCRDHFHEKCIRCGKIQHLDCHATADFVRHLAAEHGFAVDCGESVLYGVCAECQRAGGEHHA